MLVVIGDGARWCSWRVGRHGGAGRQRLLRRHSAGGRLRQRPHAARRPRTWVHLQWKIKYSRPQTAILYSAGIVSRYLHMKIYCLGR